MKILHTFVEEKNIRYSCDLCEKLGKVIGSLVSRNIENDQLLSSNYICEDCKIKFDNDQIEKCLECGRLQKEDESDGCLCEFLKERYGSSEIQGVKPESHSTKLEKQLHELSLEHKQLEEDHVEGIEATMEATANWYKRELGKELEESEKSRKRLSEENKSLKLRIAELEKKQLEINARLEELLEKETKSTETQTEVSKEVIIELLQQVEISPKN